MIAALLAAAAVSASAEAYTYFQSGVESNFLVYDGKVLFSQADGSLTLLDLQSGKVLLRGTQRWDIGQLRLSKYGVIAVSGSRGLYLLNKDSLAVTWTTDSSNQPNASDERIVSSNREGLVECRQLKDGVVIWSKQIGRGVGRLLLAGNNILAADHGPRVTHVRLLELETGNERFQKEIPEGAASARVFFDGQKIYVSVEMAPDASADQMRVFDLAGDEQRPVHVPRPADSRSPLFWRSEFTLGDRVFDSESGWAFPVSEVPPRFPPHWTPGLGPERPELPAGMDVTLRSDDERSLPVLTVKTPAGSWRGILPYLRPHQSAIPQPG